MVSVLRKLGSRLWILFAICFILFDIIVVVGFVYLYSVNQIERVAAAEIAQLNNTPTATATPLPTATLWPGPPPTLTPTSTLYPTPEPTDVLAASGFPVGFTPTPRPTEVPVTIRLPILGLLNSRVDVPEINQIYYPEPFFPAGTNNACGPVALFAALQALRIDVDYNHLRNVAVQNGFTRYGISRAGMVNTISTINRDTGNRLSIEHGTIHSTDDLIRRIRQRGVVVVLIYVKKINGRYYVTEDRHNSVGHFLIVESINRRTQTVQFAGSTLGMDRVPLNDFVKSWANWGLTIKRGRGLYP